MNVKSQVTPAPTDLAADGLRVLENRRSRFAGPSFEPGSPAPVPPGQPAPSALEFGWRDVFLLLRRRIKAILVVAACVVALALPLILSKERSYFAEARIMLRPAPALALAADPGAAGATLDPGTEIERLVSNEVVDRVIAHFDLAGSDEFNPTLRPANALEQAYSALKDLVFPQESVGRKVDEATYVAERVRGAFLEALQVNRVGSGSVLTIGFHSREPELAAAIVSELVSVYREASADQWTTQFDHAIGWLDMRIAAMRRQVQDSRAALESFQATAEGSAGGGADALAAQLSIALQRDAEIARALADIATTRASVDAAREAPDLPAFSEPEDLERLRAELEAEQLEFGRLSRMFGERYHAVEVRQERIDSLRISIVAALERYDRSLAVRAEALRTEKADLAVEIAELRSVAEAHDKTAPERERLASVMRSQQEVLSDLENRRETLVSEAQVAPVALQVLRPAGTPLAPQGASRKQLLAAVVVAGLFLGVLAATLAELRDDSVRGHQQLSHLSRFAPLGVIARPTARERRSAAAALRSNDPQPVADGIRDALFLIEQANDGAFPPMLAVAPARSGDCTIPVAELLAKGLVARNRKVWLVEEGRRAATAGGAGRGVIHLSLADLAPQPSRLPHVLADLEDEARRVGGAVLLSLPPLHRSDSLEIAAAAGRVLLVMRWGRTPRRLVALIDGLLARLRDVTAYTLIVDANPRRHRLYGYDDRLSLAPRRAAARG